MIREDSLLPGLESRTRWPDQRGCSIGAVPGSPRAHCLSEPRGVEAFKGRVLSFFGLPGASCLEMAAGALLLVCSYSRTPRRYVYGWEWGSSSGWSNRVRRIDSQCRLRARLRYSCEGGHLRPGRMFRALGNLPRPGCWHAYVFSSAVKAADAGFCSAGLTSSSTPHPNRQPK
jgi:hypothetical protein